MVSGFIAKICPVCGDGFESPRGVRERSFCSFRCRNISNSKNRSGHIMECKSCKKVFIALSKKRQYCSKSYYREYCFKNKSAEKNIQPA